MYSPPAASRLKERERGAKPPRLGFSVSFGEVVVEKGMAMSCSSIDGRTLHRNPKFFHPVEASTSVRESPQGAEHCGFLAVITKPVLGSKGAPFIPAMRANGIKGG